MPANEHAARSGRQGARRDYGEPFNGRHCTVFDPDALTESARDFGRLPDMSTWRAADIVLFCARGNVTSITDFVRDVQKRRGFGRLDSIWTHAALYIGDGRVIHVNRKDRNLGNLVGEAHVSDFVQLAELRVRTRKGLSDETRRRIVAVANRLKEEKKGYSTAKAFAFALSSFGLFADKYLASDDLFSGIVCSDVVSIAYDEAIPGFPVFATATHQAPLPATFSASPYLEDIAVDWCAIPTVRESGSAGSSVP